MEGNHAVIGTGPADQEKYNIFNVKIKEMNDFITMNSPWCLIYVIDTNVNGNKEPQFLSCHGRDQTGHYYIIESAACEILKFRCPDLAHLANNLFTEQGRLNLMNKLRDYIPLANVSPTYVNGEVAHLVMVPRICLKPLHEEYSTIGDSSLKMHFSNFPKVNLTSSLDDTQTFTVSFINANDNIIVDL